MKLTVATATVCTLGVAGVLALTAVPGALAENKAGADAPKHKARVEEHKKAVEAKKDQIEARVEEHKKAVEAKKEQIEARKEDREKKKEELQAKGEKIVDNRQDRQEKRIEHGITKGYLTEDEVKKLEAQQKSIGDMESSFKADGKLTKDEFKTLQKELNEASAAIWAEKHDTDGKQMPAFRFGKNVFAKADLTAKLASGEISGADAKAIAKDFRRMMELKRALSGELSADERAKLQAEYDKLLNQYFEVK
ncbi:MAG: hypothetical protein C0404_06930 [Verrucomicrobia bacterium]|nr:hypothetical protein [Verrucomicrobiota bacterium]